jgi:hypothetical protein
MTGIGERRGSRVGRSARIARGTGLLGITPPLGTYRQRQRGEGITGGGEKRGKGDWRFSPSVELGRAARQKGDGAPSVASAQATTEVIPRLANCADDGAPRRTSARHCGRRGEELAGECGEMWRAGGGDDRQGGLCLSSRLWPRSSWTWARLAWGAVVVRKKGGKG